jgi:hypothetical protein
MTKKITPAPTEETADLKQLEASLLKVANLSTDHARALLSLNPANSSNASHTAAAALLSAAAATFAALKQGSQVTATMAAMKEMQERALKSFND